MLKKSSSVAEQFWEYVFIRLYWQSEWAYLLCRLRILIRQKIALDEIGYSGKIYDVNNIDTDEVLRSILNAVPYKLDNNIIKSAENHIKMI